MKVLLLEDEIPASDKLINYLSSFFVDEFKYDWARSISEGSRFLTSNSYDLIIADIQLLDGISFDLFDKINVECPIIFCSAHDEYLFQAFNTNGIAYILKPYTKDDFEKALDKYQALFKQGKYTALNATSIKALKKALNEEQTQFKKRFVIKRPNGIQLLNAIDISVIEASGDFCIATDKDGNRHPISKSLGEIKDQLAPKRFFRINRSQIIQINYITTIENHFKNRLLITVQGTKEKVMTSSSSTAEFRKWIEQ
ncbi:MAG: LytTR family DNA-binding domain-containing protein [Cellulophaga sp.]